MIRDPSDGSVRVVDQTAQNHAPYATKSSPDKDIISSTTSGLPEASTRPERVERLEKSRRQLENYRKTGSFQSTTEVAEPEPRSPDQGEG